LGRSPREGEGHGGWGETFRKLGEAHHLYTLTYLPTLKLLATFRTVAHCKALASELGASGCVGEGASPLKISRCVSSGRTC